MGSDVAWVAAGADIDGVTPRMETVKINKIPSTIILFKYWVQMDISISALTHIPETRSFLENLSGFLKTLL